MEAWRIIKLMESDRFKNLTCGEFAKVYRDLETERPGFLEKEWKPKNVTVHTNKGCKS